MLAFFRQHWSFFFPLLPGQHKKKQPILFVFSSKNCFFWFFFRGNCVFGSLEKTAKKKFSIQVSNMIQVWHTTKHLCCFMFQTRIRISQYYLLEKYKLQIFLKKKKVCHLQRTIFFFLERWIFSFREFSTKQIITNPLYKEKTVSFLFVSHSNGLKTKKKHPKNLVLLSKNHTMFFILMADAGTFLILHAFSLFSPGLQTWFNKCYS